MSIRSTRIGNEQLLYVVVGADGLKFKYSCHSSQSAIIQKLSRIRQAVENFSVFSNERIIAECYCFSLNIEDTTYRYFTEIVEDFLSQRCQGLFSLFEVDFRPILFKDPNSFGETCSGFIGFFLRFVKHSQVQIGQTKRTLSTDFF